MLPALGPCFHARATRRKRARAPPLRWSWVGEKGESQPVVQVRARARAHKGDKRTVLEAEQELAEHIARLRLGERRHRFGGEELHDRAALGQLHHCKRGANPVS